MSRLNPRGTVLILALWTMMLLTVFVLHLGSMIRQRMLAVSHLEKSGCIMRRDDDGLPEILQGPLIISLVGKVQRLPVQDLGLNRNPLCIEPFHEPSPHRFLAEV